MKKATIGLLVAVVLSSPSFGFDVVNHQMQYEASVRLASNDGGSDFAAAKVILKQPENAAIMKLAVIAPDVQPTGLWPPLPSNLHGHDAWQHCGFLGKLSLGSMDAVRPYAEKAIEYYETGNVVEALRHLGCIMHMVQDASICVHSNITETKNLVTVHSRLENWISSQTAPNHRPLSFEQLHEQAWVVEYGGAYLREAFVDESGRTHWGGGLEGWVDVAAHLSYDLLESSKKMDPNDPDFCGAAHQQFANAQRCGAGLLVDFFQRVGVIPVPVIHFKRLEGSRVAVHRTTLLTISSERVGYADELDGNILWPGTSPDGKSELVCGNTSDPSSRDKELNITVGQNGLKLVFPALDWSAAPDSIGAAFYLDNYRIAISDAAEGDNWRHLWLLPAVPLPDTEFVASRGIVYPLRSTGENWKHHLEKVDLP